MNKKIIIHIILFIIIQVLINMLIFIAFIPFVKADGWVSPTSYYDVSNKWADEPKAYDESLSTYTVQTPTLYNWDSFIELRILSGISSNKIHYYVNTYLPFVPEIDVDVYDTDTTSWINVYQGSYSVNVWEEKSFSQRNIDRMRIRFYYINLAGAQIIEVDFWEITAPSDNPPYYSNIGDNEVTQVGEMVTCFSYWEDDFELDTCYIEHNATETPTNYSISVSGSSSWANKTFQLAFTKNVKVAYKFWCSDNASQWNSTGYSYITTTQLYVTFNLNNSTQGRFYIDLVNTANNTQNGYDYNQSIFLLGATYNSSYVWCNFTYSETTITENFNNYLTNGNDTVWCNFDMANITANGNGNGEYTETDLHEYFVLGALISSVCVSIIMVIIIDKKDLIRGK